LKLTRALQVVFGSLAVLFFLLALRDVTGSEIIGKLTGYEGIFCGISAIYTSIAQIWNEIYKKQILPLGIVKK
jgi:succinate-acetate transporter protein